MEMQGALVQRVLEYQGPLRSLAWVLLLGVVALGLVFPRGLVALEFGFLLVREDCSVLGYSLVLVLVFLLRCWIRILRSLRPGLGLESVLELGPSLLFGWRCCCPLCWSGRLWFRWAWYRHRGFGKASPRVS